MMNVLETHRNDYFHVMEDDIMSYSVGYDIHHEGQTL